MGIGATTNVLSSIAEVPLVAVSRQVPERLGVYGNVAKPEGLTIACPEFATPAGFVKVKVAT